MTKKPKRITVLYIRNLPQDLKDRFKAECSLRGKSMNSTIVRLIRDFVDKQDKVSSYDRTKYPERARDKHE